MPTLSSVFRWLLNIAASALVWRYTWRLQGNPSESRYRSAPLVHYGLTLFQQEGARALCQLDRHGQLETLHNFRVPNDALSPEVISGEGVRQDLRSIVHALPPPFDLSPGH